MDSVLPPDGLRTELSHEICLCQSLTWHTGAPGSARQKPPLFSWRWKACVPACAPTETGFLKRVRPVVRHLQGFRISRLPNYEPEGRTFESLRPLNFPQDRLNQHFWHKPRGQVPRSDSLLSLFQWPQIFVEPVESFLNHFPTGYVRCHRRHENCEPGVLEIEAARHAGLPVRRFAGERSLFSEEPNAEKMKKAVWWKPEVAAGSSS